MEEECPDRESSESSDYESERSDSEEEICILCLRATSGVWTYPCTCEHGISVAHLLCFDTYRNSWPVDHPNRNVCSYCRTPYRW